MRELRRIVSPGIPDGAGVRPTVWKVIVVLAFVGFCNSYSGAVQMLLTSSKEEDRCMTYWLSVVVTSLYV